MSIIISLFLFVMVHLTGFVTKLVETLDDGIGCRLVSIISDGDELFGDVGLDFLDTFLESKVALDCLLTILTVHLRLGGDNEGLDVLCLCGNDHHQHDEC